MNHKHLDMIIVGAGISGISGAYYMQHECPSKTYAIVEGRAHLGGTWDLFQYPGIRSDSDMYTLGFAFKPWTHPKAIADGPSILEYLEETAEEYGIDKHIYYNREVNKASWNTQEGRWQVEIYNKQTHNVELWTCGFLSVCAGYYNYDQGYMPDFRGVERYQGRLVHPQLWNDDIDYKNKRVVVIGSGATAVTLVPELAKAAAHVTMLQRSPTYMVAGPSEDKIANWTSRLLPSQWAYNLSRWRKILLQRYFYALARRYPQTIKKLLLRGVRKELGDNIDINKHFTPSYNPWDQRICLVPDGDLFACIKSGVASVVTDEIAAFTKTGIELVSGEHIEADLVISATGLDLKFMGGIQCVVDGQTVDFSTTISYKSVMFSDVPNLAMAFGYTNASWTLKCDLSNQYICRLLNYMDVHGYKKACPRQRDPSVQLKPWLDFTSGYILRYIDRLPKVGDRGPWQLQQNYFHDRKVIHKGKINDGHLEFL